MEEKTKEIYSLLRKVCSYGTRKPEYVKELMKYLTGTEEWKYEEGLSFYEFILRRYLDEEKAKRMIAVSGIPDKYRSMTTIRERREAYTKSLKIYSDLDTYGRQEEPILTYLANRLLSDMENNRLPRLIELWKAETVEDTEPSSETQNVSEASETQGPSVQPEIHISNNANVSPTINNTVTNDNNITVQVNNIIHTETSSSSVSMDISDLDEKSRLLADKKRNVVILLIGFLAVMLFCWLLLSKGTSLSVEDIFVSEEEVSLRPGEIYEIKPAVLPIEAQSANLSFVSLNTDVAKVSKKGVIVAQEKTGTSEIIIQAESGVTLSIPVTVTNTEGSPLVTSKIIDENEYISGFSVDVKARRADDANNDWEDFIEADVGDTIEFLIEYKNISNDAHNNITIYDNLPESMEYVPGTTQLYDLRHEDGISLEENTITTEDGINIGSYEAGANVSIRFLAKIRPTNLLSYSTMLKNWVKVQVGADELISSQDYVCIDILSFSPKRPTYTMERPADHAVFNSIIDNAAIGDERDFVRIAEVNSGEAFTSELELQPGKEYIVMIYFHNNASATYNDEAHGRVGFAENVRVMTTFPSKLAKRERGKVDGVIVASNTDPKMVWDEAYITASEAMTLHYIEGTAVLRNQKAANGSLLSDKLFTSEGAYIGTNSLNGLIPGCDEYAGEVFYRIRAEAVGDISEE